MPYPTPAYPFDPSSIEAFRRAAARMTPHTAVPAVDPTPVAPGLGGSNPGGSTPGGSNLGMSIPIVLGGVLRSDSPFLDVLPMDATPTAAGMLDPETTDEQAIHTPLTEPLATDLLAMDAVPLDMLAPTDGLLFLPFQSVSPEPLGAASTEPALPAPPFDRAAVERARARARGVVERVEATVMSDDGATEHVCDVTAWLAGATTRELDALAQAGWTGDEAAEVADALAEDDPEVADVVRHARRADAGVVVEIDGRAAMAWLARHRPAVVDALDDARDDAADDLTDED